MLIAALIGYKLFPYVPTIDLHKYWHSLRPIIEHTAPDLYGVFHYFGLWLATDCLVATAIKWEEPPWIPVVLFGAFIFGSKVVIVDQVISCSEIIGATSAFLFWLTLHRRSWTSKIAGVVLCTTVVAQRLAPFNFVNHHADFGWLPFQGFLRGSLAINIQSMFEKGFLYGSLIWFATLAGVRLPIATAAVATLLLAASAAETYLPGRSGEITDAILAVAIGFVIFALQAARKPSPNPAPKAARVGPQ
jgi:hypothetical protein